MLLIEVVLLLTVLSGRSPFSLLVRAVRYWSGEAVNLVCRLRGRTVLVVESCQTGCSLSDDKYLSLKLFGKVVKRLLRSLLIVVAIVNLM